MKTALFILCATLCAGAYAQQPAYTTKNFVSKHDTVEFKGGQPIQDGLSKTYILANPAYYDVDDNNTTHILGSGPALIYLESQMKSGQKNGATRQYLIDSADHSKRYLISQQMYANGKLNGRWDVYNLKGTLVSFQSYKDDSLHGLSRDYWIDGNIIMNERVYTNGRSKFLLREFHPNGKVLRESPMIDGVINGEVKIYYETGVLKDKVMVQNDMRHGLRIYYYPDGKPWIENIYKDNKPWEIVANYDSKGKKRDGGTLKDGNGTTIYYDDDTTVREVITYRNGEPVKN